MLGDLLAVCIRASSDASGAPAGTTGPGSMSAPAPSVLVARALLLLRNLALAPSTGQVCLYCTFLSVSLLLLLLSFSLLWCLSLPFFLWRWRINWASWQARRMGEYRALVLVLAVDDANAFFSWLQTLYICTFCFCRKGHHNLTGYLRATTSRTGEQKLGGLMRNTRFLARCVVL